MDNGKFEFKAHKYSKSYSYEQLGPVKKQATRPVAAWLDKQNKQLLIAIISLRSTLLRQAEEDDPPRVCYKNMILF